MDYFFLFKECHTLIQTPGGNKVKKSNHIIYIYIYINIYSISIIHSVCFIRTKTVNKEEMLHLLACEPRTCIYKCTVTHQYKVNQSYKQEARQQHPLHKQWRINDTVCRLTLKNHLSGLWTFHNLNIIHNEFFYLKYFCSFTWSRILKAGLLQTFEIICCTNCWQGEQVVTVDMSNSWMEGRCSPDLFGAVMDRLVRCRAAAPPAGWTSWAN